MPWSWVHTEYSIHREQHTPSTASIEECLSSVHSHDWASTTECFFNFRCTSLQNCLSPASSQWELKGKVTWSHFHSCEWTNGWMELYQHPVSFESTALQLSSNLTWPRLPIMPCKSQPQSASLSSLDNCLQVYLTNQSITASKLASPWPPCASANSLNHNLQVHLWVHSIIIFRRTLSCSPPLPSASPDMPCIDG